MLFKRKRKESTGRIVVAGDNVPAGRCGYDRLRDNVLFMNADGTTKAIQIESAVSDEGKTTTACNLAVSLGQSGKKTVVVELDFHHPKAHRVLKVAGGTGIAEYILGTADKSDIIKHTEYPYVDIVTRGAAIDNPPLVYMSEKFKSFMTELKDTYDYVILDCAPILQSSDYIHISEVSDGVLFLAAHSRTTRSQVEDAVKELGKNGIKILGSVFTMYNPKKNPEYRSMYGYYDYQPEQEEPEDGLNNIKNETSEDKLS